MDDDDVVFCSHSTIFASLFCLCFSLSSPQHQQLSVAARWQQRVRGEMNLNFNEEDDDDEARKARMELCWVIAGEDWTRLTSFVGLFITCKDL